ncbi:hypothetical protein PGB28_01850 [Primorskyibacter aestuariivivens]|uniref:hypothetical protein n=1 Tax=Primorskyibacter aestuariivivens TaxID=1888912 RepID=UPI002300580B|nr:hypothetical protein [Primorskyibacter aestuariivivens]MDA7427185.1 hypothetical protein [Primorskyibacter aestuariivivens]
MSEAQYRELFHQLRAQIAVSGMAERERLIAHLQELHQEALSRGIRIDRPGTRPELDRIDEDIEAQFDNFPI